MRVVVTGANGFVGRAVCAGLSQRGDRVVALVRDQQSTAGVACDEAFLTGPLERIRGLPNALRGADAVIHTAGWSGSPTKPVDQAYVTAVNVGFTSDLAAMAAQCGVSQFIYISSIKAMGSHTTTAPFSIATPPAPLDLYGCSKLQAEQVLLQTRDLAVSIIRPPLVYGPGMKGSLLTLFRLAHRHVPLPLASVNNARDFLALPSLVGLVVACLDKPNANNRILLARDGHAVSSAMLYRQIAAALGTKARLLPFPPEVLRRVASLAGRSALAESLLSSLVIDDRETRVQLGWSPVCSLQDALTSTAEWFIRTNKTSLT